MYKYPFEKEATDCTKRDQKHTHTWRSCKWGGEYRVVDESVRHEEEVGNDRSYQVQFTNHYHRSTEMHVGRSDVKQIVKGGKLCHVRFEGWRLKPFRLWEVKRDFVWGVIGWGWLIIEWSRAMPIL